MVIMRNCDNRFPWDYITSTVWLPSNMTTSLWRALLEGCFLMCLSKYLYPRARKDQNRQKTAITIDTCITCLFWCLLNYITLILICKNAAKNRQRDTWWTMNTSLFSFWRRLWKRSKGTWQKQRIVCPIVGNLSESRSQQGSNIPFTI